MSSASDSQIFSSLTLNKLHLSVSSKGTCSLHRWVLLKNSIHLSSSITSNSSSSSSHSNSNDQSESDDDFFHHLHPSVSYSLEDPDEDDDNEEVLGSSHINSFMFPDAGKLLTTSESSGSTGSEAQWLDSLLETLADDDDDDFTTDSDSNINNIPVDDDDFSLFSPLASPLSSSDDLPSQSISFYSSSSNVQYSDVSYSSPYHQPSCSFNITFRPSSSHPDYEHPLPYHDNHIEVLSVPDAIEDTSDDESDAPTTPSLGRSNSSLSDGDSSSQLSPSTPPELSRLRHPSLHVYDHNDSNIISFEIDPLPFPDQHLNPSYNFYDEEC